MIWCRWLLALRGVLIKWVFLVLLFSFSWILTRDQSTVNSNPTPQHAFLHISIYLPSLRCTVFIMAASSHLPHILKWHGGCVISKPWNSWLHHHHHRAAVICIRWLGFHMLFSRCRRLGKRAGGWGGVDFLVGARGMGGRGCGLVRDRYICMCWCLDVYIIILRIWDAVLIGIFAAVDLGLSWMDLGCLSPAERVLIVFRGLKWAVILSCGSSH